MQKQINYFILFIGCWLCLSSCDEKVEAARHLQEIPVLFPDYTEVTVPASVAPLNFTLEGEFSKIDVVVEGERGSRIHVQHGKEICFPLKAWRNMLEENKGGKLMVHVSVKRDGQWWQYTPFPIYVSEFPVDYGLVYRRIAPGYEVYSKMGIYERNLSDFRERPLIENTLVSGCVNCHSFPMGDPSRMSLHIRGDHGGTVLTSGGSAEVYHTKTDQTLASCVYPYWHPSGKYIAYSVNETQQVFHSFQHKRVEVVDWDSDVVIYNVETQELFSCPQLKAPDRMETFPAFSPDGQTLYFCSAEVKQLPAEYDQIRYSLCSIGFDPATGRFSEQVDTLVSAADLNKSVSFPRPSYDGTYLMYTLSDYGNFSIWHPESDLWLMDLATGETRALDEVNSDNVDSYHSWSSNSRWFVFSSRRIDGLYTRPYLASIDEQGKISKPFLLPQEHTHYYENSFYSFNIPEFVTGPVQLDPREVEHKALSKERKSFTYKN
ncbi:MAG: hypothetical protein LUG51_10760 [Tannerellaceae bacterium]|nr:hypothetical protein [Tannerellaceae bacterium]